MFCNQCEQTAKGTGCSVIGVCGKNEEVADLQDLLVHAMQGLALYAQEGRRLGIVDDATDRFTYEAIFSTLTNVDFDPERFVALIKRAVELREAMKAKVAAAGGNNDCSEAAASFIPAGSVADLVAQGKALNLVENLDTDENVRSLKQTVLYGLKGIAAYADHAAILGKSDPAVAAFCYEALATMLTKGMTVEQGVPLVLKTGEINLKAMELLDAGNTGTYGHPVPTPVPLGHRKNKCVLITGHDLRDLEMLLKQTEGKGIDVYTHGEMLPCHGYPELKKYPHFYGHFGTAWQNQQKEFPNFPGPILFTTNCIQKPLDSYKDRVFTNGLVGWPGVKHITDKDYSAVVKMALAMDGFTDEVDGGQVLVGFGRNAVLGVADKVIEAVKAKAIRHF
ncbi:MAG: hydroxylamine reductase, partial [Desulfobulbaceae bacterium]|nr:hydroxylamine reductase [Desulfobulbaceae bacterium]